MKMLPVVSKPRRLKLLVPLEKPFSPALKLMPGVFFSTSVRVRAFCSRNSASGMMLIVSGVSSSGAVCFGEDALSTL